MTVTPSRPLDEGDALVLARAAVFRGLSAEARADVAARARRLLLKRGQTLFAQGEPASAVFLVLRGRVKVLEATEDGQAVVLRVEGPGELLGLLAALGEAKYPVTAEALEPTQVARWPGAELSGLLQRHPAIAAAVLPVVLERLRAAQDLCRELATERVERRLARAVLRLVRRAGQRVPEGVRVDVHLTRQELAEMAGTTLFTASRLLSRWAAQGLLQTRRRRLLITDPHGLVRLAEDLPGGRGEG